MPAFYDIFLSHAWADGDLPKQISDALTEAGLHVWFDANEIADFASITKAVTEGLVKSKALLAYYSKAYALRRACQWELTAAFLAAQHEGDPCRRVLVINPEETADHIHPVELRDAKFKRVPDNDAAALEELVHSIVMHTQSLEGPLADIHPMNSTRWYGNTPVGSTNFVGRVAEMWEVHSLLHARDVTQITGAPVATGGIGQVSGLGGIGKSLLAEEYAIHFGPAYPGGIFWLRAYGNDDAKSAISPEAREVERTSQVQAIAERMAITTLSLTPSQIEGALGAKIEAVDKLCLWIVDDLPNGLDRDALQKWFAPHPLARTLITTRSREYASLADGIDLSVLAPEEAYVLLTSRRQPKGEREAEQAHLLTGDLGCHALALDVTASALQNFVATAPFASFRTRLAQPDKDALELAAELSDTLPNRRDKSIAQTLLLSIGNLGTEGTDLLRLASFLSVAPIPDSLVVTVFEQADNLSQEDAEIRASLAFKQVTSASLADVAGENQDARAVHTLVSHTVRFCCKDSDRTRVLRAAAIVALNKQLAGAAEGSTLFSRLELLLAHARQLVTIPTSADEDALVGSMALHEDRRGAYASCRSLLERQLIYRRWILGFEDVETLTTMHNLASAMHDMGDSQSARLLGEEVLRVRRRILGPEDPETLAAMNNLAETMRIQGDLAAARELHEQTLQILRRVKGDEDPTTLMSMGNLAVTLDEMGDREAGRKLKEQALPVLINIRGKEHRETLFLMNNLAQSLKHDGDLEAARKLQEETLDISGRALGIEHPQTLLAMQNLAQSLKLQGDLDGARQLHEAANVGMRRKLGAEHPNTLASMNNLAETLIEIGDLKSAGELQKEVLAIRRRMQGPMDPATFSAMKSLAETLRSQGDWAGAGNLYGDMLEILRSVRGSEDPDTLKVLATLGAIKYKEGDVTGARDLLEHSLMATQSALGTRHEVTSLSAWYLFRVLTGLEEHLQAEVLFNRELAWLLECDPSILSDAQREIRDRASEEIKNRAKSSPGDTHSRPYPA